MTGNMRVAGHFVFLARPGRVANYPAGSGAEALGGTPFHPARPFGHAGKIFLSYRLHLEGRTAQSGADFACQVAIAHHPFPYRFDTALPFLR